MKKINFVSPIKSQMGYAQMARLIWPALKQAGEVGCHDIDMQSTGADLGTVASEMLAAKLLEQPDVTVVNMVPTLWHRLAGASRNIGYTTFEADRLPPEWAKLINSFDTCWTTSEWNKAVMERSGVLKPVRVITPIAEAPAIQQKADGKFTFLASFQWSERKNPYNLIKAFVAAFNGSPDVRLIIKTHVNSNAAASHTAVTKDINTMLAGMQVRKQPDIQVNCKIESLRNIQAITAASHAHFSMSHGEGWGLPAWEAALAGKPVIATDWAATAEWLGKDYPYKVRCNMSPVSGVSRDISPFFDISMNWAEPHVDDAVDKLRYVVKNYSSAQEIAAKRATELLREYSEERTLSAIVNSI